MRPWVCRAAVVLVTGAALAGCSADAAQQEISGAVTLDGLPLKDGHIRFAPTAGNTSSAEVFLREGRYTAKLTVGSYRVEIYSPRSKGNVTKRIAGPGQEVEEVEETIPARYNVNTELSVELTKDKKEYDFPLKSK
jgi:hypothetical protein